MELESTKIVSEYDQALPQSLTSDKPLAPRGRATQQSQDIRKTNLSKATSSLYQDDCKTRIDIRGGSIINENPFITPSTNELGLYAIYQTKDQSVAVIMVHETLFYLSKFNKLQTF